MAIPAPALSELCQECSDNALHCTFPLLPMGHRAVRKLEQPQGSSNAHWQPGKPLYDPEYAVLQPQRVTDISARPQRQEVQNHDLKIHNRFGLIWLVLWFLKL